MMSDTTKHTTEHSGRDLQERLNEAESMLQAIRDGEVDALLISREGREQVFTLTGADLPYRIMIEQMQEGAITLSEHGIIIYCNRRFADLIESPIHKVLGRSLAALFHADDVARVEQHLREAHHARTHLECRLNRASGETTPVLIAASPFVIDGHQNLCLTVTNLGDLMDARRESQQLKEFTHELELKVAERTGLLESQAHRLRVLALQLTDAEHRERKRLAELIHDHLQQLLVAAKMRLDRLGRERPSAAVEEVQRLLQESLNCARSLTTELRPPVLYEDGLIAAIHWLSQHMKQQYEVEIATCLDVRAEPSDENVKAFLYQAVRELVFNAVKHAYIDELRIYADFEDAANRLRIAVEDDGVGFDVLQLRERQSGNEGLGLFSIQERITALGGTMDIRSKRGEGTCIVLDVPLKPADEKPAATRRRRTRNATPASAKAGGAAVRVMLVDDHQLVREGIRNLLKEHAGIAVVGTAENGQEAVSKAAELRPDVILMDANMPLMNGIEATRNIRSSYPDIKVVGLSVQNDEALRDSFQQAGASAFLSKDGDLDCLFETILSCRATASAP